MKVFNKLFSTSPTQPKNKKTVLPVLDKQSNDSAKIRVDEKTNPGSTNNIKTPLNIPPQTSPASSSKPIGSSANSGFVTTEEDFNLQEAISYLDGVKPTKNTVGSTKTEKHEEIEIRAGMTKNNVVVFYLSNSKSKNKDQIRKQQQRESEPPTTTRNRAITMFKEVAQTLVNEGYLTQEKLTTVFEPIEKQIDLSRSKDLLALLENGNRNKNDALAASSSTSQPVRSTGDNSVRDLFVEPSSLPTTLPTKNEVDLNLSATLSSVNPPSTNPFESTIDTTPVTNNTSTQPPIKNESKPNADVGGDNPSNLNTKTNSSQSQPHPPLDSIKTPKEKASIGFFESIFSSITGWFFGLFSPAEKLPIFNADNTNINPPVPPKPKNSPRSSSSSNSSQPVDFQDKPLNEKKMIDVPTGKGSDAFLEYVEGFSQHQKFNIALTETADYAKSPSLVAAEFHLNLRNQLNSLGELTEGDQQVHDAAVQLLSKFRPNSEVLKAANAAKAAKLQTPTT